MIKNLAWFQIYLFNRKQYIDIGENSETNPRDITCGVLKDLFSDRFCF